MIRVVLPVQLRRLARADGEVQVDVDGVVTPRSAVDALETRYPMLRGTIRDHVTFQRRPMIRYYASVEDISHDSVDVPLPEDIATGKEPFLIIGAMAGG